ncbi:hypothetical protein ACVWZW_005813 [Bradyrhizobium sp. F1.13.4]
MNFVNRHFPDREVTDRVSPGPIVSRQHKWPLRYDSIEYVALCADIATIVFASVVSTWLSQAQSGWAAGDLSNALGLALVSATCLVCLLKTHGLYRPAELLVLRSQMRAVWIAWASLLFLIWAGYGFAIGSGLFSPSGHTFRCPGPGLAYGRAVGSESASREGPERQKIRQHKHCSGQRPAAIEKRRTA